MSRSYLVIDGYNLMHAAGIARRRYGPGQLERCRRRLLDLLARRLTPFERERTTVVFDAHEAPPDLPRESNFEGMLVCFAAAGKDADDTIEEIIAGHSSPRQIRVVSSDHRLQKSARKRRGAFVDSDEFLEALERRSRKTPATEVADADAQSPAGEKGVPLDTEMWLGIFGDISATDDIKSTRPMSQADVAAIRKEVDQQEIVPRPRAAKRRRRKGI